MHPHLTRCILFYAFGSVNKADKLKAKVLTGQGFHNFAFADLISLLKMLGFVHDRSNGSHFIFKHPRVPEPVVIQEFHGKAKPYQLRQVRDIINEHSL